jgi:PAS domain-containing protein
MSTDVGPGWSEAELAAVADGLARARVDLLAATDEAAAAAGELEARSVEIGHLNDILDSVLAATDEVVAVVDVDSLRVRGWSRGAATRTGISAREARGRSLLSVRLPGLSSPRLGDAITRLSRSSSEPVPQPDGLRLVPVRAEDDGALVAVVVAASGDVHARPASG